MRLWFDTNALWRKHSEQRALTELARSRGFTPAVSAQVYLEDRRQTRVRLLQRDRSFSESLYDQAFIQLYEVIDIPFDRAIAGRWADRLASRYPERDAWKRAKQATLGGKLRAAFEQLPSSVPMTTDWWIALAVEDDPGARIVTAEGGEEWRALRDQGLVLSWDQARTWLDSLSPAAS